MNDIINYIDAEKDILEQLIKIDNEKMFDTMTYDEFFKNCMVVLSKSKNIESEKNILFVTEGNPILTLNILNNVVNVDKEVVIFLNQGYQGLNKWLYDRYKNITGNIKHSIDLGSNYNKYIGKDYKVVPLGEKAFRDEVLRDFYE